MPESIDSVELDHLRDIRGWRAQAQAQLDHFEERVRTFRAEVHDAEVMERGHQAFLRRKYGPGATIFDDGHIERPAKAPEPETPETTPEATQPDTPVVTEPEPSLEAHTDVSVSDPLENAPIDTTEAEPDSPKENP